MASAHPTEKLATRPVDAIAWKAFRLIARHFPVCAASDEFYFFPQILDEPRDWAKWDDFSAEGIEVVSAELRSLEIRLAALDHDVCPAAERIDADLLQTTLRTLREQLEEIAPHRQQPTFHLTIVAAGLAEALSSADSTAWTDRISGVPRFLQRAADCLDRVPLLFQRLGRSMFTDLMAWVGQLEQDGRQTGGLRKTLEGFQAALDRVPLSADYRLPEALFARLVETHIGCGMAIDQVTESLDQEFHEMQEVLQGEASHLLPGRAWTNAEPLIPFCQAPDDDLLTLYRRELTAQQAHCRAQGLVPETPPDGELLQLATVPTHLSVIRASDAYNATPGHPPRGGVFYVMQQGQSRNGRIGRTLEYRMTSAHEAWPGHHLLDYSRWNLANNLRRPIEQPLFYEGWACLAEELMARTGYLTGPWDRFLLARRRIERAARGLVDLGMQTGRMTLPQAVALLVSVGYRPETAQSVVPKYLLRPGYQVCYTMGLKQGLDLLARYGRHDIGIFVRQVLAEGEIGFSRLAQVLSVEP